eukprot:1102863-Alexandrium_andersonii.AAC.1
MADLWKRLARILALHPHEDPSQRAGVDPPKPPSHQVSQSLLIALWRFSPHGAVGHPLSFRPPQRATELNGGGRSKAEAGQGARKAIVVGPVVAPHDSPLLLKPRAFPP